MSGPADSRAAVSAGSAPFSAWPLLRTDSVEEAQAGGSRLLTGHQLNARGAGFRARINGVSFGGASLYYMRYGVPLTVSSAPLGSFLAVLLPLRGSIRVHYAGSNFLAQAGRSAAVISPEVPHRLDWTADLEFFFLRIELDVLRAYLRTLDAAAAPVDGSVRFEPWIIDRAALAGVLGSAWLVELSSRQQRADGRDDRKPALDARLCEQVMTTLLLAQPGSWQPRSAPRHGRRAASRAAVRRARELVEESPTLAMTPSELARAVGVSLRTLQLGLRDELDTTPQALLTEARLHRAHTELVCANPEQGATVADIAARWGFSNVGRFAARYSSVYGCRPAETLRRC